MKIADGIYMLEISANIMGGISVIYPTLLCDNGSVILIDTGFPGQLDQIREAIEKEGVPFSSLNGIILTHQDIDHVGTVSDILKELPGGVKVLSHEEEKPFINGEKQPVKLAQLEHRLDSLPDNMKALYANLKAGFQKSKTNVDTTLTDDEELPYCGGITVIHTPGHTPGHICLYLKSYKLLIAGDMLNVDDGELIPAAETTNFDIDLTFKSLKKLRNYDIETIICYHGGLYKDDVNNHIAKLAKDV